MKIKKLNESIESKKEAFISELDKLITDPSIISNIKKILGDKKEYSVSDVQHCEIQLFYAVLREAVTVKAVQDLWIDLLEFAYSDEEDKNNESKSYIEEKLLSPRKTDDKEKFISKFMSDETSKDEFPDIKQRFAVCMSQWERRNKDKE